MSQCSIELSVEAVGFSPLRLCVSFSLLLAGPLLLPLAFHFKASGPLNLSLTHGALCSAHSTKYRARDDDDSASDEEASNDSYEYDSDMDDGLSDIELPDDSGNSTQHRPEKFFGRPVIATKIEDLD